MPDITRIESHWNTTVEPSILEQYRDSTHWKAQLKAVIDRIQDVEDAAYEASKILDFEDDDNKPTGSKLDWIASLANVKRKSGESDGEFFVRFKSTVGVAKAGTPDDVISNVVELSGSTEDNTHYLDELPAVFFVYTPDGSQLLRRHVRQLAPAGVLGVPGAAIKLLNGNFMLDAGGRRFLAVADDTVNDSKYIMTEDGKRILTEDILAVMTEKQN